MEHHPLDFAKIYNDEVKYPLIQDVCEALEMSPRSVRRWAAQLRGDGLALVIRGSRKSETGALGTDPVLPGFAIKQISTQVNGETGETEREWIQTTKAHGDEFELPEGQIIAGISALVDAEDRVIQRWVKTKAENIAQQSVLEAFTKTFERYKGFSALPPEPQVCDQDLLTVYNIADHHLGLFSWIKRTGVKYDLKTGKKLLLDTMGRLIAKSPASYEAIVLNLGDFFHADNSSNRTARSGNALDVDGDYPQILEIGVELLIACIEMALQKHQIVRVRNLPGNHDEHLAVMLGIAAKLFFANNPRVIVDTDPSKFFVHLHGKVMVTATHGDMVKPDEMAGVMASYYPGIWGKALFRYAYFGHVHHKSRGGGEKWGMVWETFQSLAGKDGWHHGSGYSSGRSMVSITHSRSRGEVSRTTENVH